METMELNKEIMSPETSEVVKILEGLDKVSIVLAKVYLTALGDRQEIEGREVRDVEKHRTAAGSLGRENEREKTGR